jgi:hypothetical protein
MRMRMMLILLASFLTVLIVVPIESEARKGGGGVHRSGGGKAGGFRMRAHRMGMKARPWAHGGGMRGMKGMHGMRSKGWRAPSRHVGNHMGSGPKGGGGYGNHNGGGYGKQKGKGHNIYAKGSHGTGHGKGHDYGKGHGKDHDYGKSHGKGNYGNDHGKKDYGQHHPKTPPQKQPHAKKYVLKNEHNNSNNNTNNNGNEIKNVLKGGNVRVQTTVVAGSSAGVDFTGVVSAIAALVSAGRCDPHCSLTVPNQQVAVEYNRDECDECGVDKDRIADYVGRRICLAKRGATWNGFDADVPCQLPQRCPDGDDKCLGEK